MSILKKLSWEQDEIRAYVVVGLAFAFILTFNDWGTDAFDAMKGVANLAIAFVLVLISLFVHDLGHRLYAIKHGYKVKFKVGWLALLISVLICFVSASISPDKYFKLFFGGGMALSIIPHRRLGKFGFRADRRHEATISVAGPVMSILFAALIGAVSSWFNLSGFVIDKLLTFNVLYAVYTLLPIPPFDGFKLFWWSRLWWAFSFAAVAGFAALALAGTTSLIFGLVAGGLGFLLFYYVAER